MMARSTGLPRQPGISGMVHVIRARTSTQTISRIAESKGSLDESTTTTSEHTEDIWLFRPNESVASEVAGDRIDGSLGGLAIADGSVDIHHQDRVTYGGVEYEVDTIVGQPEDSEPGGGVWGTGVMGTFPWGGDEGPQFWVVSFDRRQ